MPETYSPFTILSQRQCGLLRAVQTPTTVKLQEFTPDGLQQVELNDAELAALLRALPADRLREVLEPNPFFALDDEAAEVRAELRRLHGVERYA